VHHVENHGVEQIVTLRVDDQLLHATIPPTVRIAIDSPVRFTCNAVKVHLFDAATGVNLI
jgi:multiple sugar transport system ATP-binding protein